MMHTVAILAWLGSVVGGGPNKGAVASPSAPSYLQLNATFNRGASAYAATQFGEAATYLFGQAFARDREEEALTIYHASRVSHKATLTNMRRKAEAYRLERSTKVDKWEDRCFRWGRMKPRKPRSEALSLAQLMQMRKREYVRAWAFKDSIISIGGCPLGADAEDCFDDVWSFNTTSREWAIRRLQNLPSSDSPLLKVKGPAWSFDPSSKHVYSYGGSQSDGGYSSTLSVIVYTPSSPASPQSSPSPHHHHHQRQSSSSSSSSSSRDFILDGSDSTTTGTLRTLPYSLRLLQCTGESPLYGSESASLSVLPPKTPGEHTKLVIFGGYSDATGPQDSLHVAHIRVYDESLTGASVGKNTGTPRQCVWERPKMPQTADSPEPRFGHASAVYGNTVYIFGGTDMSQEFNDLLALSSLNTGGWKWNRLPSLPGSYGRSFAALTVLPPSSSLPKHMQQQQQQQQQHHSSDSKGDDGPILLLAGGCGGSPSSPASSSSSSSSSASDCPDFELRFFETGSNRWRDAPPSLLHNFRDVRLAPEARRKHTLIDATAFFQGRNDGGYGESRVFFLGGCSSERCFGGEMRFLDTDGVCTEQSCATGRIANASARQLDESGAIALCECKAGFQGKHCDSERPDFCPNSCSGNGHCFHTCICKPGFEGDDCSQRTCPNSCTDENHGRCDTRSGQCSCHYGFWGPDCSLQLCPRNCTGHGLCTIESAGNNKSSIKATTACTCQDGYSGPDCSVSTNVASTEQNDGLGTYKSDDKAARNASSPSSSSSSSSSTSSSIGSYCHLHCSGHGFCQRDNVLVASSTHSGSSSSSTGLPLSSSSSSSSASSPSSSSASTITGQLAAVAALAGEENELVRGSSYCACERGFGGRWCERECPLFCSGHGFCQDDGSCVCDKGYAGLACNQRYCVENCMGRGTCDQDAGVCRCNPGYGGDHCQIDATCQGHGKMLNGTCQCDPHYGGADCSIKLECPKGCSGHGKCNTGALTLSSETSMAGPYSPESPVTVGGVCECDEGFHGLACEKRLCPNDCWNNGYCQPESGNCSCYSGYFGSDCATLVTCPSNCTGTHGMCMESGKCACRDGWTGPDCAQIGCPNDCSGNGKCKAGICECDEGFSGASCAVTCKDGCLHGKCIEGTCHCDPLHHGPACNLTYECPTTTSLPCSGNGVCDGLSGKCTCQPGYEGEACDKGMRCPGDCNGHGECVVGSCICQPQWTGPACLDAPVCPGNCSFNGMCLNSGSCLCFKGFKGDKCELFESDDSCPSNCSNHGQCFGGRCYCAPGYHGDSCQLAEKCEADQCNGNGVCAYGKCFCYPGYGGPGCTKKEICPLGCSAGQGKCVGGVCHCLPGFSGPDCASRQDCPLNCTGRGVCVNGACACLPGYSGAGCESGVATITTPTTATTAEEANRTADAGASSSSSSSGSTCPSNCNGRGVCKDQQCFCLRGYEGLACEIESALATKCESDCSKRGSCHFGQCFCQPGFFGDHCQFKKPCPYNCSKNGVCAHGKCFCVPGWIGKSCSVKSDYQERKTALEEALRPPAPKCPNACSMHGVCVSGRCFCETGYGGPSCAYVEGGPLAHRCANNCSDHGECLFGKCYCHPPYFGKTCERKMQLPCPMDCHGRGICSFGKCMCDAGFDGVSCGVVKKDCSPECDMGLCIDGTCRCIHGYSGKTCSAPPVQVAAKSSSGVLPEALVGGTSGRT